MPLTNLFKNCGYYWGFAAFVSYFVNHPLYTPPSADVAKVLFTLAMLCQAANLRTHIIQRNLRPPGGKDYVIPRGFGFDYITCANYTFEIWGWILFAAATWTLPALIFITAGAAQMALWAKAKHARLRKVRMFPSICWDALLYRLRPLRCSRRRSTARTGGRSTPSATSCCRPSSELSPTVASLVLNSRTAAKAE
jgi:hypothetical protein